MMKKRIKMMWVYLRRSLTNIAVFIHMGNFAMNLYAIKVLKLSYLQVGIIGTLMLMLAIYAGKFDYKSGSLPEEVKLQFQSNEGFQVLFGSAIMAIKGHKKTAVNMLNNFMGEDVIKKAIKKYGENGVIIDD